MGRRLIDITEQLDHLAAELASAIERDDEQEINAIVDAMQDAEERQKRQDKYLARKQGEAEAISALTDAGMPEDAAQAQVTGKTVEQVRKINFIAQARRDGYNGAGFDALVTAVHRDRASNAHAKAMIDCLGYMDKRDKLSNGYQLWFASDNTVRANATDELLEWFATHGRLTRAALRESVLSGKPANTYQLGR